MRVLPSQRYECGRTSDLPQARHRGCCIAPAPVRIGDLREAPGLQIEMSIQKDAPEQINSTMGKGGVPCPAIAVARASRCVIALVQDFPAAMRTVERFQASFFELGELFVAGMHKSVAAERLEALSIS